MSTVIVIPYRSDYSTVRYKPCEITRAAHATCVGVCLCARNSLPPRISRKCGRGRRAQPRSPVSRVGHGVGSEDGENTHVHTQYPSTVATAECGKTKERKRTHRFTHHEFRFFWEKIRGCREELMVSQWPVDAERVRPLLLLRTDN